MKDAVETPSAYPACGERAGNARLTTEQVIEIRQRYAGAVRAGRRLSAGMLAKEYNVSKSQIKNILARRQWRSV